MSARYNNHMAEPQLVVGSNRSESQKATLLINRELSWLEFNQRVLDQAFDPSHPLLERVKFLSIVSSNLDEFFMVRVATLLRKQRAGLDDVSVDGLTAPQQL